MWFNWKRCVQLRSSLLLIIIIKIIKSHPCYVKNKILYVTSTDPYSTWLIQMIIITFHSHFWWKFADSTKLIKRIITHQTQPLFQFFFFYEKCHSGYFWFGNKDDGNRNDKNYIYFNFFLLSWCKNLKYFAKILTSPSYIFSVWDYLIFSILFLSKIWVTELTHYLFALSTYLR